MSTKRVQVRNFLIIFVPLTLLFVGPCFYVGYTRKPPKEVDLINNFNAHRAAFEQLRDMLIADTNISRIGTWGVDIRKPFCMGYPTEKQFPLERFKKYQTLLKEAGGKVLSRREGDTVEPEPSICVWAWGWAGTSRHIGICWLNQSPTNQISTLDGYNSGLEDGWAYRHIDSNWYFWTDL
jgi:hypothetical protein